MDAVDHPNARRITSPSAGGLAVVATLVFAPQIVGGHFFEQTYLNYTNGSAGGLIADSDGLSMILKNSKSFWMVGDCAGCLSDLVADGFSLDDLRLLVPIFPPWLSFILSSFSGLVSLPMRC